MVKIVKIVKGKVSHLAIVGLNPTTTMALVKRMESLTTSETLSSFNISCFATLLCINSVHVTTYEKG